MTEQLFETPDNPMPSLSRVGAIVARDGIRLRYALFPTAARPLKGTVLLLTGRNETIEKYFETIGDFQARGFGVAICDWRGQGGSGRMLKDTGRGYVQRFADYVNDLEQFFQEVVLPDCRGPFYIVAHSAGALVALLAAPAMTNRIRRMVLAGPLLELAGISVSMRMLRHLAAVMWNLGLGTAYLGGGGRRGAPEPFATNKLTSDDRRYRRNVGIYDAYPRLATGGPTAAWVHAACVAAETVMDPDFRARIQIPSLLVAPGNDEVVNVRSIEALALGLRSGSLLVIDGARHEIMQEADRYREQFLAAFDAFIPGESADW